MALFFNFRERRYKIAIWRKTIDNNLKNGKLNARENQRTVRINYVLLRTGINLNKILSGRKTRLREKNIDLSHDVLKHFQQNLSNDRNEIDLKRQGLLHCWIMSWKNHLNSWNQWSYKNAGYSIAEENYRD